MKKGLIKVLVCLIALIALGIVFLIVKEANKIKIETERYETIQDIIDAKYCEENIKYLENGEYAYIVKDLDVVVSGELVWKDDENKYIICNSLNQETANIKANFEIINLDKFMAYIYIYIHNDNTIIIIDRYAMINENSIVYDNYNEWEETHVFSDKIYFQVIKNEVIKEDYEVNVYIDEETYYLFGAVEINNVE